MAPATTPASVTVIQGSSSFVSCSHTHPVGPAPCPQQSPLAVETQSCKLPLETPSVMTSRWFPHWQDLGRMVLQLTFPALATDCALFHLLAQLMGIFPVFGPPVLQPQSRRSLQQESSPKSPRSQGCRSSHQLSLPAGLLSLLTPVSLLALKASGTAVLSVALHPCLQVPDLQKAFNKY